MYYYASSQLMHISIYVAISVSSSFPFYIGQAKSMYKNFQSKSNPLMSTDLAIGVHNKINYSHEMPSIQTLRELTSGAFNYCTSDLRSILGSSTFIVAVMLCITC